MGAPVLSDKQIVIGKAVDDPQQGGSDPDVRGNIGSIDGLEAFKGKCPLWTYILAEAALKKDPVEIPVTEKKKIATPKLGAVGGRIVAEVFLGLIFGDNNSYLSLEPNWQPPAPFGPAFRLKDFVTYALGK